MDWDKDNPLGRHPAESSKAHAALNDYAALGPGRSLARLAEATGKNAAYVRQLERWSSAYAWQERVAAHDAQLAERVRQAQAAEWERRAVEGRELGWSVGRAAVERALELLAQTAIRRTQTEEFTADEDGRKMKVITIREAPAGSLRDIAALLKAGGEALRLATGQPTAHGRLDITVPTAEELAGMSEEELAALEAQIRPLLGG